MRIESLPNGGRKETTNAGTIIYELNNKLHREDGPAIEYDLIECDKVIGDLWFLNGVEYFPKDNDEWLRWMKMKALL
jgi:hypothetical protein